MKFAVDLDAGDSIHGWLTLDNPNETPTVQICVPGREPIEMLANVHRQDLLDGGWHGSGLAGFRIDTTILPGIAAEGELELREPVSRMLIYRRFDPGRHVDKRLLLLDAGAVPQKKAVSAMNGHFAIAYNMVEGLSSETLNWIAVMPHGRSVLLTGRPSYMRHVGEFRQRGYVTAALLRDPFEELTERLLFLNLVARSKPSSALSSLAGPLMPLAAFARDLPFDDEKVMTTAFRNLPIGHRQLLRDPLTRMLACHGDEKITRTHVTQALDNLAAMDVVGTRARFDDFRDLLTDAVGVDVLGEAAPESWPMAATITERVARIGMARDLLEHDLALYSYVEEALETGLSERGRGSAAQAE